MIEDIEGLVVIKDFSLYFLMICIFIGITVSIKIFKFYIKRKNRPPTKEEIAIQQYKQIDFSNPKKASYLITKYGYILAKDEKSKEIFKELLSHLTKYKYKKKVEEFDEKTIGLYNLFLEVVSHA